MNDSTIIETINFTCASAMLASQNKSVEIIDIIEEKLNNILGEGSVSVLPYKKNCYYIQIRNYGNYLVDEKNHVLKKDIEIAKGIIEDGWKVVSKSNFENEWYAYTDNEGNIKEVNEPKLAKGMYAINYVGDETASNSELISGTRWANAMTKEGSMWVWIPRYAYKITYINAQNKNAGGVIEVAFLKDNTNEFIDNSINGEVKTSIDDIMYTTNDDGTLSQDQWLLAPAFSFGDKDITGFWFAKFEASNTAGYGDSADTANSTELTLQIRPKMKSWRNITSTNAFNACLSIRNTLYFDDVSNVDTHMMRNSEWGAVAYLAHSTYGLNGIEICNNADYSYRTGSSSGTHSSWGTNYNVYNSTKVTPASTTKNVYGVYDMSGGAHEYVAGCLKGHTSLLTTDNGLIEKYVEIYESKEKNLRYGDAIRETTAWFKDYNSYFWTDSGKNIFLRGFASNFGPSTGLFAIYCSSGETEKGVSFRPALIVE